MMTMKETEHTGRLVIFTAPSGAGKTTIVKHLLNTFDDLSFSVSATSRQRRPHEEEGKDYYFMDAEAFKKLVDAGAFLEWEEVYENQFYGTLKSEVDRLLESGKNVIFDIDVEGAVSLKKVYEALAFAVFVKPPSKEILFERLKNRKTETAENLAKRIAKATRELAYENKFDYVLVNDELDRTLREAETVVARFLKNHQRDKNDHSDHKRHQN